MEVGVDSFYQSTALYLSKQVASTCHDTYLSSIVNHTAAAAAARSERVNQSKQPQKKKNGVNHSPK